MDARKLLELVATAQADGMDYHRLAALVAEGQREADAKLAEAMGQQEVADAIRAV